MQDTEGPQKHGIAIEGRNMKSQNGGGWILGRAWKGVEKVSMTNGQAGSACDELGARD